MISEYRVMVYRRGRYYKTVLESNSQDHTRRKTKGVVHLDSPILDNGEKADLEPRSNPPTADMGLTEAYQVPVEVYDELEKATSEQRTEIVLRLIEGHPHGRLELSASEERRVNLQGINLSRDMLQIRRESLANKPPWWSNIFRGADLHRADLHDVNLRDADLQGANLQNANLQGAFLEDAKLIGATLQGAKFQGATLQGTTSRAPTYSAPTWRMPTYWAPTFRTLASRTPTFRAPTYGMQTYGAPTYSTPTYRMPS